MKLRTLCLMLSAVLLAGCWQKSLNAFYTPADVAYDGRVVGVWHEQDKDSNNKKRRVWTFTDGINKGFKLNIQDDDKAQAYAAHLFKLDGHQLLDIMATERTVSTIPAHHLFKVIELKPDMKLAMLNVEWMQEWLRKNPGELAHFAVPDSDNLGDRDQDELILTAETKALQKFLKKQWGETNLFSETIVLQAVPGETTAKKN